MIESLKFALALPVYLFTAMAPVIFVVVGLVLLVLALWATSATWHSYRILDAVANAPLVDLRSMDTGLVKVHGTAQPVAKPGQIPSGIVWYERSSRSGSGVSTLVTTDPILIQDDYGICAVDSDRAEISPTIDESKHDLFNKKSWSTEKIIQTGDPLFAIGELRRDQPSNHANCELTRFRGVLLVSGSSERSVKILYRVWFLVQLPAALLWFGLLAFGTLIHINSYPPSGGSTVRTFIESLQATPFLNEPGVSHPLWKGVEPGEESAFMKFIETLLSTHQLEPTLAEANSKLLEIGPPFGLQLDAPPVTHYADQGWMVSNVGGISMFMPPGWTVVEQDNGINPMVGLVAPNNDCYIELRLIRAALRRPGITLEEARNNYISAKERGAQGIVLGYAPLSVDGAFGLIEIMNEGGVEKNQDGSFAHRTNRYLGAKRIGEEVFTAELRATFDQANQDKYGPTVLNIIRSIQFKNVN